MPKRPHRPRSNPTRHCRVGIAFRDGALRLDDFVRRLSGDAFDVADATLCGVAAAPQAGPNELAPLFRARYIREAQAAARRGAVLLVDASLAARPELRDVARWVHPHAAWVLACLLDACLAEREPAVIAESAQVGAHVVLYPGVRIGERVRIGDHSVIGRPGFGWAMAPDGTTRRVPQLGGVVIEDDAEIGALCTIDAGTLAPTRVGKRVKIDAQCHVGHNVVIETDTIIAAQSGLAGSVHVGPGVLIGGQVGISDHVTIGAGARIAAKSGVIGDISAGATVAGYPAIARQRWFRGIARAFAKKAEM